MLVKLHPVSLVLRIRMRSCIWHHPRFLITREPRIVSIRGPEEEEEEAQEKEEKDWGEWSSGAGDSNQSSQGWADEDIHDVGISGGRDSGV
jgi:hypothetical protein